MRVRGLPLMMPLARKWASLPQTTPSPASGLVSFNVRWFRGGDVICALVSQNWGKREKSFWAYSICKSCISYEDGLILIVCLESKECSNRSEIGCTAIKYAHARPLLLHEFNTSQLKNKLMIKCFLNYRTVNLTDRMAMRSLKISPCEVTRDEREFNDD